ncbi:hypothetical protein PHLCEN_2v3875 [Hermanssonia centrifuga]|uniref:Uncharacterized protein n=1 Tax=Hermanssonia centrifuga TaxID=98765 RepID=A0A2R6QB84_9APHY|nr:hypothetical protein PHLCEN_2v3875 [Hermanssonia centrifuga]
MSPNPNSPPGESATDLWFERSNFDGAILGGVAYGAGRRNLEFLLLSILLLTGATINLAGNGVLSEEAWIDDRGVDGGPIAWLTTACVGPNCALGNYGYIISNFFADGLLLWRTYTVWNSVFIIAFPFVMFLASTGLSIIGVYQTAVPGNNIWSQVSISFLLPYLSISISLTIILTLLIVGRLLYTTRLVKTAMGEDHAKMYTSTAALIVESAAPYAFTSILFIIVFARGSNVQNLILPILAQVMCISPELIILRVARGNAWTTTTTTCPPATTVRFKAGAPRRNDRSGETTSVILTDVILAETGDGRSTLASSQYIVKEDSDARGSIV